MLNPEDFFRALSASRPVFHSEADFQHALAWLIHQQSPESNIRLEYRPPWLDVRAYLDILIEDAAGMHAIELKYKTRRASVTVRG